MQTAHLTRRAVQALALALVAHTAAGQEREADPLAAARAAAAKDNQRVLVHLTGGDATLGAALDAAIADYRTLGKLIRYEYQLAAFAGDTPEGVQLLGRLDLDARQLPALGVVAANGEVLGRLPNGAMAKGDGFDGAAVKRFLEGHACEPLDARKVLADGVALAKKSQRKAFVYISAPW